MEPWTLRALCRTLPEDWWDLPSDGNRLAMGICSVCPVRVRCGQGDPDPRGVVRAGVAYRDTGEVASVCPCGRPIPTRRDRGECFTCEPRHDLQVPKAYTPPTRTDAHRDEIAALVDAGYGYRAIGRKLGLPATSVRSTALRLKAVGTEAAA